MDRSKEQYQFKEAVFNLIDDFLKLPEGKLVTAKGKHGDKRGVHALEINLDKIDFSNAIWDFYL